MQNIGVDLASAERPSLDLLVAVVSFLTNEKDISVTAFVEAECKAELEATPIFENNLLKIVYCQDSITMKDVPSRKLLSKKTQSSMLKSLRALKTGAIDTLFSPGNTGALLLCAREVVGVIKGVSFPAAVISVPRPIGDAIMLDVGADLFIDEDRAIELAIMGNILYEYLHEKTAKIGLINVGSEFYKGSMWTQKANRFFKKNMKENYYGFVEGFDIFQNKEANVFVTGGYTGNVMLKSWEGFFSYIAKMIASEWKSDAKMSLLEFMQTHFHYSKMGTGIVLGCKKSIFLGHGSSTKEALYNALVFMKNNRINLGTEIRKGIRFYKRGK